MDQKLAAILYSNLAAAQVELKGYKVALKNINQALAIDSDNAIAHRHKGRACRELGDNVAALLSFERAVQLSPEYAKAKTDLDDLLDQENVDKERAKTFTKVGYQLFGKSQYEKSLEYYLKALDIYVQISDQEKMAEVQSTIGAIYIEMNQEDLAMVHLEEAIHINPLLAAPHRHVASIYRNRSDIPRAIQSLIRAIELNTNYDKAKEDLYEILKNEPEPNDGIKLKLTESLRLISSDGNSAHEKLWSYLRKLEIQHNSCQRLIPEKTNREGWALIRDGFDLRGYALRAFLSDVDPALFFEVQAADEHGLIHLNRDMHDYLLTLNQESLSSLPGLTMCK